MSGQPFEMKQHIGTKVWHLLGAAMMELCSLVQFGSAPLRSRIWKSAPLKKFAKSSITQLRIDRSRSNSLSTWHQTYHIVKVRVKGQGHSVTWHISMKNVTFHEWIGWLSLNFVQIAEHVKHVQDHKVKYWNHNNSAADCSILLKFGTEFHQVTGYTLQMLKVKGQGHTVKDQGHSIT